MSSYSAVNLEMKSLESTEKAPSSPPATRLRFNGSNLKWDSGFVTYALFPTTTVIFGVAALALTAASLAQPSKNIDARCWPPTEFLTEWSIYTNEYCASRNAIVYRAGSLVDMEKNLNESNKNAMDLFTGVNKELLPKPERLGSSLFLLMFLSIAPFVMWILLYGIDGMGLVTLPARTKHLNPGSYSSSGILTSVCFILVQLVTTVLIIYMLVVIQGEMHKPNVVPEQQPESELGYCDFEIRALNRHLQYTVQCLFTKSSDFSSLRISSLVLTAVGYTCYSWAVLLLIVGVINMCIVVILAFASFAKEFVLNRFIGPHDTHFEACLGWADMFVALMASRGGYAEAVSGILRISHDNIFLSD